MIRVTYNIEGLYPVRGTKERMWMTWLSDMSLEQARSTVAAEEKRKKRWLPECYSDLRIVKVTTETIVFE